ncbi:NrtR-regulated hypothetical NrtX, Band 7 protein domain [hydrothermal vent metagenome]|uniref:NrtR-regulated hypothetical NrtX, Band 7 protein domain n=1 Tax=hydrothermal vent metagenome TaxID=652676 RepID=A0A3B0YBR1_9ZZZZ
MFYFKYIKADPNTCIMLYKSGKIVREGRGQSFFYFAPTSFLAAIPVGSQEVPFMLQEVTRDFQEITVQGQFIYRVVDARKLSELMNYSLKPDGKTYESDDPKKLPTRIMNLVQIRARSMVQKMDLREVLGASENLVNTLKQELSDSDVLESMGVSVMDIAIMAIKPTPETSRALEASAREKLLQEADEAIYIRRNASVEQERSIKENELLTDIAIEHKKREIEETKREAKRAIQEKDHVIHQEKLEGDITLEDQRKALVEITSANSRKEADDKAYAVSASMEAMAKVDPRILEAITSASMNPEQMISQAFRELAKSSGKIGELNISPDLLQSLTRN